MMNLSKDGNCKSNWVTMDLAMAKEIGVNPIPRIADTKFSDFDTPFYLIDAVADFHADESGNKDATTPIQNALNAMAMVGGGIVYLPPGRYRLMRTLRIPQNVTLRGDWKRPTDTDKSVAGTILCIEHGAGTNGISGAGSEEYPGGASVAILLKGQGGIRDLSIFYPQQSLSDGKATPYPFSIDSVGQFPTVRNITLVNSYDGMYFGVHHKGVSFPNAICVYGCPLHTGWVSDRTVASPRYEHIAFGPRYWSESGLRSTSGTIISAGAIRQVLREAGAVGFLAGWGCGGGVYVSLCLDGYDTGILTTSTQSSRLVNVFITDCRVGIDMAHTKGHGWVLTNGEVEGEEVALRMRDECCHIALNTFMLTCTNGATVIDHKAGVLTLMNCTLRRKGVASDGIGYSIQSDAVSPKEKYYFLSVVGCHFEEPDKHISLGPRIERVVVYGNTSGAKSVSYLDVSNESEAPKRHVVIDTSATTHKFAKFEPIGSIEDWLSVQQRIPPPPPGESHIFSITDHGANGQDPGFDNTAAIQVTLDLAGSQANAESGCIVFIPTGVYRIRGVLQVPSHVELRGSHDGGFCEKPRSMLCFFATENNRPTQIRLAESSGLRGLVIFRPDQTWDGNSDGKPKLTEYPFAVKGTNRNWAYDLVLANTYNGLDFSAGGGHALEYVHGCTLNRLIKLGSSGELSVAYNIQCKDQFWRTLGTRLNPEFLAYANSHLGDGVPDTVAKSEGLEDIGLGMVLEGTGHIRVLAHFVNRSANGLYMIKGSPKVRMYGCGGEGKGTGVYLRGDDTCDNMDVEIISNSYHTDGEAYTISNTGLGDQLKIVNCKSYGIAKNGHIMRGKGKIVVQQEYRNRRHEITYQLRGETQGVYEGGFLEAGTSVSRVDVAMQSHAVICAVLAHRDKWHFTEKGKGTVKAIALCPRSCPNT